MREMSKDNLLRSWKDISAYLGCDTRTCHRWEARHGMPVHRAEGGGRKSPVFAYRDELDAWFKETFRSANGQGGPEALPRAKGGFPVRWAVAAAAVLALAGGLYLLVGALRLGQPADFRIEGSVLAVLDRAGRELWRVDTGLEDLRSEADYREAFQVIRRDTENHMPWLMMKDIDADGDAEVLFAPKRRLDQTGEGWLFCYDRSGVERWRFRAGGELRCPDKVHSADYRVYGFHCHDLDGDGRLETVVYSYQAPDWPCYLTVLDSAGRRVGEYLNAGYLRHHVFQDLDGDGREEMVVVGVNNEYRGGCLAVFDTRRVSGGSPQSGRFACEGVGPGSELYYVTVPFTDVSEAQGAEVDGIHEIYICDGTWIRVTYGTSLLYEFDFGLKPLQASAGHGYEHLHREYLKQGKIASVLDGAYFRARLAEIRWWDGSAWSSEPTGVRR